MKLKHPATLVALVVWILTLVAAGGRYSTAATFPQFGGTTLRVESGGRSNYIDTAGNLWIADTGYIGGHIVDRDTIFFNNTEDDRIYQTERYGMTGYILPVASGSYTVRLHFAEDNRDLAGPGKRVFSVIVEGVLIPSIDVFAEAGGLFNPLVKTVDVTVSDAKLDIQFVAQVDNPQIKGIEVLPAQPTATPSPGAPPPTATPTQAPPTATPTQPPPTATPSPTTTPPPIGGLDRRIYLPLIARVPPAAGVPPACGDAEDRDDTPEGAAALRLGVTCVGSLAGDGVYGDDWFSVSVTAGKTLVVDLSGMPAGADYDLFLFDARLNELASHPQVGGNRPEHVEYAVRASGTFYVRIVLYTGAASGSNTYWLRAATL